MHYMLAQEAKKCEKTKSKRTSKHFPDFLEVWTTSIRKASPNQFLAMITALIKFSGWAPCVNPSRGYSRRLTFSFYWQTFSTKITNDNACFYHPLTRSLGHQMVQIRVAVVFYVHFIFRMQTQNTLLKISLTKFSAVHTTSLWHRFITRMRYT